MPDRLTFEEFLDLVLSALYDLEESQPGELFDVNEISAAASRELDQEIPEGWAFDAVKLLDDQGLIVGLRAMGGVAHGSLTGAGRLEVERRRQRERDEALRQAEPPPEDAAHGAVNVHVEGTGHQIAIGVQGSVVQTSVSVETQAEALALLSEIELAIRRDDELTGSDQTELLADVAATRSQIEKRKPNTKAAIALLEPLSQVATISGPVLKLIELLA
jgi:hypothetical protein